MFYESEKEQGSIRDTKFSSALGEGVCRVEKVPEEVILALRAKDYSVTRANSGKSAFPTAPVCQAPEAGTFQDYKGSWWG